MKKYFIHFFLFLMAFQVEVKVRASASEEVIKSTSAVFHYDEEDLQFHLGKGSSLVKKNDHEFTLVSGYVWFEKCDDVKIHTPYGDLVSSKGGFWLFAEKKQYRIRNINSSVVMKLKDSTTYEVPEGFEVWFAGIQNDGSSAKGMIEPVKIGDHLKVWNKLYTGSKDDFKSEVSDLKEKWKGLADTSSEIYQKVVERHLDSIEDQKQNKKKKEQDAVREKNYLHQKFYDTTFSK